MRPERPNPKGQCKTAGNSRLEATGTKPAFARGQRSPERTADGNPEDGQSPGGQPAQASAYKLRREHQRAEVGFSCHCYYGGVCYARGV